MRLLLATRNAKKLVELERILAGSVELVGLNDVTPYPEAPEAGLTFEENALLKAREAVRYTGLPSDRRRLGPGSRRAQRHAGRVQRPLVRQARRRPGQPPTRPGPDRRRTGRAPRRRVRLRRRRGVAGRTRAARSAARCAAGSFVSRGAKAASATTRSSWPTARPHERRADRRRKGRDQPPWQGVPRTGRAAGRRAFGRLGPSCFKKGPSRGGEPNGGPVRRRTATPPVVVWARRRPVIPFETGPGAEVGGRPILRVGRRSFVSGRRSFGAATSVPQRPARVLGGR